MIRYNSVGNLGFYTDVNDVQLYDVNDIEIK